MCTSSVVVNDPRNAVDRCSRPVLLRPGVEEESMNFLNWDSVALLSLAMVVIAILIFLFLGFKVVALMNRDAKAHKNQQQ